VAMGERSNSLSVVLTPGYAPFEQYHRKGVQGPWTDIYSCAALLYQMITGEIPPEAPERADLDELRPPGRLVPGLSPQVAQAILTGLALKPRERPQTIQEFQSLLTRRDGGPTPPPPPPPPGPPSQTGWKLGAIGFLAGAALIWAATYRTPPSPSEPPPEVRTPPPTGTRYTRPSPITEENKPPRPVTPVPNPEPPPSAIEPPEQTARAVESVVRGYYAAVGRRDVATALGHWKNPHSKSKTATMIASADYAEVRAAQAGTIDEDRAVVRIDVVVKSRGRAAERWRGDIELEPMGAGRWGIVKMNLNPADKSTAPAPSASPAVPALALHDQLTAIIRAYYAALDQHDVATAAAMWRSAPGRLGDLVRNSEFFKVNDARVASAAGREASVWVDIYSKARGRPVQHYQGTVEMDAGSGRWLIVSMRNLKEVP
jgi:hypothetical protein